MSEPLAVSAVANLAEALAGVVIAPSVNGRGHATMLVIEPGVADRIHARVEQPPGGASFPITRVADPYAALFVEHDGTKITRTVELAEEVLAFPSAHSLPDGGVVVVGARCWGPEEGSPERNARVYDEHGRLRGEFTAGDGIKHVGIDRDARIWVGYSDEGVYGNYGWDRPIGASGLVRFNTDGEVTWRYRPPAGDAWIDACYALNVSSAEVWACYYSAFPLARISDDAVSIWRNCDRITGATALAIAGDHVLLAGGYLDERDRAVLLRLDSSGAHEVRRFVLTAPDGSSLAGARMIGSGAVLHVFTDTMWYRVDIADLR